ncbi:MAG: TolC family protein [candidate division WOR-3 bacterium]
MKIKSCLLAGVLLTLLPLLPATADTLELDVDRAVELALANPDLVEMTAARLQEAAAGRAVAFGSFLPQLSGTGTYTRLAKVSEFTMLAPHESVFGVPVFDPQGGYLGSTVPIPVAVGVDTYRMSLGSANNYVLRASLSQTLFTWGKLLNAWRIADLNLDIQREAARQSRAQARVQAIEAFYQAMLAQRLVELMRESEEQLRRHVEQVERLCDNGLASKLDVMRARVGLTNMRAQVVRAETGAELALSALRHVTGLAPDSPLKLVGELVPETCSFDLDALTDSALRRRPELLQLRRSAQVAELGRRIAGTAGLPTAFATLNYDYKNPVGFSARWGSDWNVTAGISWPIFTGGANLARLKQAEAREKQARIAVRMLEEAVRLEVQAQTAALRQEQQNLLYQQQNAELADQALKLAEQRYQSGTLTNLEYLDTQLQLTQARVSYLNSLAACRIARARLARAAGEF